MAHYKPGVYRCKILDQAFGESKEKKTPFLALKVKPLAMLDFSTGELIPCDEPAYERTVTQYLTDNTIEAATRNVRSLGFNGTSFRELDPEAPGHVSLADIEAEFSCKHEPYDGGIGERWDFPASGSKPLEKVSGLSKRLDAMFGKFLKGSGPKSAPAKSAKQGAVPVAAAADECPF